MTDTWQQIRPALYYPYIHIRSEHWLKSTLLCVPAVKRIVPDTYTPEDIPNIVKYTQIKGPNGALLQAVPSSSQAANEAQHRLLETIRESRQTIERRFDHQHAPKQDEYWIHKAKFSDELLDYLIDHKLAWSSLHSQPYGRRTWYALHPILGSAIMTTLGLSIAREHHYDIVTPNVEFHEKLLATEEKDIFDALLGDARSTQTPTTGQVHHHLGQLVIDLTGVNYQALRPEDIPELQSSKSFCKFQRLIRVAARNVQLDANPEEYREQLRAEAEEIIETWHEARNDLGQRLKDVVFGEALPLETLKVLFREKAPEKSDLLAAAGYVALRLFVIGPLLRQKGPYQYLTEITQAQNQFLRMTTPLGLEP